MHRALLLLAAGGLICLSQPALAASGYIQLSKPNTDYYAFMQDRNACLSAASHRRFARGGPVAPLRVRYNFEEFTACMGAKGYRLDANGYRAAWFSTYDGRHYQLRPDRHRTL